MGGGSNNSRTNPPIHHWRSIRFARAGTAGKLHLVHYESGTHLVQPHDI